MNGYFLTADLMSSSRVAAAAQGAGVALQVVMSTVKLLEKYAEQPQPTVVIDLTAPGLKVADCVAALQAMEQPPQSILAYGPHVHAERLAAAEEAGCTVFTRGQFISQMGDIFAQLNAE